MKVAESAKAAEDHRLGLQIRELEGLEKTVSQKESDVRQILAAEVLPITQVVNRLTSAVEITISETDVADQRKMSELQKICLQRRGDCDLILRLMSPKYGEIITRCGSRYNISYDSACISQIEDLFGGNSAKPSNRTSRVAERSPYSTINYA